MLNDCSESDLRIIRRAAWALFDYGISLWFARENEELDASANMIRQELRRRFEYVVAHCTSSRCVQQNEKLEE